MHQHSNTRLTKHLWALGLMTSIALGFSQRAEAAPNTQKILFSMY